MATAPPETTPPLPLTKRLIAFVVYCGYRGLETLCRVLPLRVVFHLGRFLGWLVSWILPGYLQLAERNLRIAFGRTQPAKEIRRLARQHFTTLGGNLLSSFKVPWMSVEEVDARVEWVGLEHAAAAQAAGHGFIFALLHMGNWEILSQMERITAGAPPGAMFQRLANPYLNDHVVRLRARTGCTLFDRRDGFFAPTKWLRENGTIGILVDQHAGDAGVWVPLFDRLASTTNLIHLLAMRAKAPILPVSVSTIGSARWRVEVLPPLPIHRELDVSVALMNQVLEQIIRRSPADWFWVHNRWKTPKPNFLLQNYKRGVVLPPGFTMDKLQPFEILLRSTNWLGDACMALPAVRAIRRGRPDARLTVLTQAKLGDFWRLIPEVDEVLEIPASAGLFGVRKLVRQSGRVYDAAVLLPNSLRSALEVKVKNVHSVVGYAGHWRKKLLTQIIPTAKHKGPLRHHSEHYLRIAERLGGLAKDPTLFAPVRLGGSAAASPLRLGLCPGAEYGPAKRWPIERYAEAALAIAEQTGCEWVIFGAKGDIPLSEELTQLMQGSCLNLTGKTSLQQLAEALQKCTLLLTNDTGTMHFAAALGVPTVAIFGSTEPDWTGPLGPQHTVLRRHVECSPCFKRECPIDFRCMKEISPDHVVAAVLGALQEIRP
jgi:heptosyltransferase-2